MQKAINKSALAQEYKPQVYLKKRKNKKKKCKTTIRVISAFIRARK